MPNYSEFEDISDIYKLTSYLTSYYLPLLAKAGHHALYSLPDFNNLSATASYVDYSFLRKDSIIVDKIYGISAKDINIYLCWLWFQAHYYVLGNGARENNSLQTFLSEMRIPVMYGNEKHFMKLVLRPMQIRLLCSKEIILEIDFREARILGDNNESSAGSVYDVTVSYIVGVKYSERDEGISKQIELDFKYTRYCEHLSNFETCLNTRIKGLLIDFVTPLFIKLLEASGNATIFYHDARIHDTDLFPWNPSAGDDLEGSEEKEDLDWEEIRYKVINGNSYGDFDLITALTQRSINNYFRQLWETANKRYNEKKIYESESSLASFTHHNKELGESFFTSTFLEPKVQLNCEEGSKSVILYITLDEGQLKPLDLNRNLQPEAEYYPISQCCFAFDVELNIEDSPEDTIQRIIHRRPDYQQLVGFKQLVLRLDTAKLRLNLSSLPDLSEGDDYRQTCSRFYDLVYYIQTYYFPELKENLFHILYYIPQNISCLQQLTDFKVQFNVVPFRPTPESQIRQGTHGRFSNTFDRNTIVIWRPKKEPGLLEPMPNFSSLICITGKDVPYGSLCLPYCAFFKKALALLKRVNRETTVVPTFFGFIDGQWIIKLATWGNTETTKTASCGCMSLQPDCGALKYAYRNQDVLTYDHEGCPNNGKFVIKSITENVIELPTQKSETPEIKIKGEVRLSLSCKIPRLQQKWSADMFVSWKADIKLSSSPFGLQVVLQQPVVPTFRKGALDPNVDLLTYNAVFDEVGKIFPKSIDCDDFVNEWDKCLVGSWTGLYEMGHELCVARPIFNNQGDLFLDLAIRSPMTPAF
ncbi:hypothetical protein PNOK_0009300 [Pyrrhoderma noxium]|uniref:Uncharacterized protein n=1 Tax=Pyrrhoderma noxium TaxID=2282107 RepID=A0A286UTT2_9AGAM|nr:hypothetical protein PNOK_0009300 [Pyrrhoderma noxium]